MTTMTTLRMTKKRTRMRRAETDVCEVEESQANNLFRCATFFCRPKFLFRPAHLSTQYQSSVGSTDAINDPAPRAVRILLYTAGHDTRTYDWSEFLLFDTLGRYHDTNGAGSPALIE